MRSLLLHYSRATSQGESGACVIAVLNLGLVRNVLGIQPDADGVLFVFDRNEFGISLRRKRMQRSNKVQLVLAGGEERVHHLHRHLYLHLRSLLPVLLKDMSKYR